MSKTVEVDADAALIMEIVARLRGLPAVERGDQGSLGAGPLRRRSAQPVAARHRSTKAFESIFIQAVYYPGDNQIQTVMQQGDLFAKQEQLFSVVRDGADHLLTVDLDVETTMPVPTPMVKKIAQQRARPSGRQPQAARRAAAGLAD